MASFIYRRTIAIVDRFVPAKLQPYWNSEAGPKTVFFWGAVVKAGLVAASISDLTRPAEKLSPTQSLSLATTGVIWSRWSLVIIPKNYPLFVINSFVGITNFTQFCRAIHYEQTHGKNTVNSNEDNQINEPLNLKSSLVEVKA